MRTISLTLATVAAAAVLAACGQQQETAATNTFAGPGETGTAAPAAGAEGIIKARQANLKKFGAANKAMQDELKKPEPALAVYQTNLPTIAALAPELHTWFPAGTGMETKIKTAAKPEVWAQPELFKARADAFVAATQKFQATVQSGDMAAIKAGAPEFGQSCRNCHEIFRQRDE